MTDNRTTELLPCPFCGGEAKIIEAYGWLVQCTSCFASVGQNCTEGGFLAGDYRTEAEAIAAWNSRAERTCKPTEPARCLDGTDCPAWLCSECGELFELGANFCSNCGAKVEVGE